MASARLTLAAVTAGLALGAGCSVDATTADRSGEPTGVSHAEVSSFARQLPDTPGVLTTDNRIVLSYVSAKSDGNVTIPVGVEPGDVPIAGDWDGDGISTPGFVRNGNDWHLAMSNDPSTATWTEFTYGDPGDRPVVGDWDGDGVATVGVVRGTTWYLRNSNSYGNADISFVFGSPGDIPVAGDWNGDGISTPGVVRNGYQWSLRNSNSCCNADINFTFGAPGMTPVVGDWDGDGTDTPGMFQDGIWYLSNHDRTSNAETTFLYGGPGMQPIAGHWISGNPQPYEGGPLLLSPKVYLIYYGNWTQAQQNIINRFVQTDLPASAWYRTIANNYYDSAGNHPGPIALGGTYRDLWYSQGKSLGWDKIANEVDTLVAHRRLRSDPNGIYLVLESPDLNSGDHPSCGAHTTSSESGLAIGWVLNAGCTADSDCGTGKACVRGTCSDGAGRVPGCIGVNRTVSPNGDVGVDAMLSAMAHEIAEAITDPSSVSPAWVGPRDEWENGDLCEGALGTTFAVNGATANMAVNGRNYLVQQIFNPRTNFCSMTP